MIFMLLLAVFLIVINLKDRTSIVSIDGLFFGYTMFIGIVMSIFCSLHIGTEYSDGTIRNKLVVGQHRTNVYLATLVVSITASILMALAYIIPAFVLGTALYGFFELELTFIFSAFAGSMMMIIALASIFTLIGMLIQNKAFSAVIAIVGMFIMIFAASYIASVLDTPETYDGYIFADETGKLTEGTDIPNPNYVSGTKRVIYEYLLDILPTGQALQYTSLRAVHLWQMPLYSLIISIVTTCAGVLFFRRKALK